MASITGCAIAALTLVVDTETVKRAIERQVLQAVGGEVNYESALLRLLPPVRAEFSGVRLRVPGVIDGTIATLHVGIAWLPLLKGEVRLTAVRIERPTLEVHIGPGQNADPFAAYRAALGPIVENAMQRHAAGVPVRIERGALAVVYSGRRIVALSNVEGTVDVSDGVLVATASAAADLWGAAQGEVRIVPGSLAASAKLQVTGLRPAPMFDAYQAHNALQVLVDTVDATVDVATDGHSTVQGSLLAAAPRAVMHRAGQTLGLGAIRVAVDGSRDSEALVLTLREFQAGDLLSGATGILRAKPDGTAPVLELRISMLDLERVGAAAMALADDLDTVRTAVDWARSGTVRELTLRAAAGDLGGLGAPSSMRAEARLDSATVAVPPVGILILNGSGRFVLVDSALQGSDLAGDIGGSSFDSGAVAVDFLPKASLRKLRGGFNADLADALALSRRLLERRNPAALAGIEALGGRASGTVNYEASRSGSPLVLELAKIQATGRYRGMPFPLEVSGGALRYSGHGVLVRGLTGRVGGSRLHNASIDVALGSEPAIRSASGEATLALVELQPRVSSFEWLPLVLRDLKKVTGTAAVRVSRLSGPIHRPASLDFDIAAQPQQVELTSAVLPGPLTLSAGSVSVTPRALRLEQLQVSLLDARVTASGTVENYAAPERRVSLDVTRGSFGQETIDAAQTHWKLAAETVPLAPIALSAAHFEWNGGTRGTLVARGTASLAGGARAEFDLAWQPDRVDVRRLALKDADSDAAFHMQWSPARAEVSFNGRVHLRTLERSFALPLPARATLQGGDFRASIDLAEPRRSSAHGSLEIEGLNLHAHGGVPVTIERMSGQATGRTLHVREGVVRIAGERLAVSGTLESGEERFAVDVRVSGDALDAARLLSAFPREGADRGTPAAAWDLPLEGRVAITADSIAYDGRALKPFAAAVSLAPNRVVVEAKDARLCGIAIPFRAVLTPGGVEASARLTARNQSLAQTVPCLAGDVLAITGDFDLDAEFSASGSAGALVRDARGSFRIAARTGRIHRAETLSRALAVDEVAARVHAAPADMLTRGLEYEEIALAGTVEGGRVHLDHGMLDSASLGVTVSGEIDLADGRLDMQGLFAPLDTVHRGMRRVPILGRVFGGSLVVVPAKISGTLKDPDVKVLAAEAVSATLINFMTGTFLLPVKLFNPAAERSQR